MALGVGLAVLARCRVGRYGGRDGRYLAAPRAASVNKKIVASGYVRDVEDASASQNCGRPAQPALADTLAPRSDRAHRMRRVTVRRRGEAVAADDCVQRCGEEPRAVSLGFGH